MELIQIVTQKADAQAKQLFGASASAIAVSEKEIQVFTKNSAVDFGMILVSAIYAKSEKSA